MPKNSDPMKNLPGSRTKKAKDRLGPTQRKWVDALRSGEYKQGFHSLTQGYNGEMHYDVMGVLCDVVGAEQQEITTTSGRRKLEFYDTVNEKWCRHIIPQSVADAVGLMTTDATLGSPVKVGKDGHTVCTLMGANDNRLSFEILADLIEKHADKLFKERK